MQSINNIVMGASYIQYYGCGQKIVPFLLGCIAGIVMTGFFSSYVTINNNMSYRNMKVNNNQQQKMGWKDIHVFFGDDKHLQLNNPKSQTNQDELVRKLFRGITNGYFIDLAANDATDLSNSYRLETDYNWNGICVEPNPRYWHRLSYRKCHVVAAVIGGETRMEEINFIMHNGYARGPSGGIVGFDNKANNPKTKDIPIQLYTVPIREILQQYSSPNIMDYLSLDVEGAEFYIMKHFPFDQYRFRVMTVERPNQELVDLLYEHGYRYMGANNEWGMETLFIHQLELQSLQLSAIQEVGWRNISTKYMEVHPDGSLQHPPKVIWKD